MRALVFYDHTLGLSSGTSMLVKSQVSGIEIFGGLIMTTALGGLNPRAVKTALHYGDGAKWKKIANANRGPAELRTWISRATTADQQQAPSTTSPTTRPTWMPAS